MTDESQQPGSSDTDKVSGLMKGVAFAMLTTVDEDGAFVSRPMAHQDVEFDGDLWFVSSRKARKVSHIEANPHVGVSVTSSNTWVSVNGTAEVVDDHERLEQLWGPGMEAWFPGGPDDSVVAIKVSGDTAEYWDTPGGRVATVLSLAKAKVTGKRYAGGDNETVDLKPAG